MNVPGESEHEAFWIFCKHGSIMRYLIYLLAVLTALLSGCASTISSEVTAFHQWPPASDSQMFVFSTPPEQEQSLEYQSYERLIQVQLERYGLHRDEANAAGSLKVEFSASATGRDVIIIETVLIDSFYGTRWYGPGFSSRRPMWPSMPLARERERRYTVYQRQFKLKITDIQSQQTVYEGTVRSEGEEGNLVVVIPYLVESMFKDFPGQSGLPRIVKLRTKTK